ncbi:MAG: Fur family transcriptional regulator [Parvibaculales bacterium]
MSNQMTLKDEISRLCTEKNIRMTGQRLLVAEVLSGSSDHPDVEELHKRASKIDKAISIATVYRTLNLFEELGILTRHDFKEGKTRYEASSEQHHDHLIDVNTGEVIEFVNERIEQLQEEIAKELGYRLIDHRLELYGVKRKK